MHASYEANPGCAQPTSRMRATPLIGVLVLGGALASAKFAHGVHAHGVQPCSEPQCSVAALPSSTSVCARGQDQAVALSACLAGEACAPLSAHNVQSCFESLCCTSVFAPKLCLKSKEFVRARVRTQEGHEEDTRRCSYWVE